MVAIDCNYPVDPDTGFSCCWDIDTAECCPPDELTDPDHVALVTRMAAVASIIMARLSGYTIGQCSATVRPLTDCPECRSSCCGAGDSIQIQGPMGLPVDSVTEVRVDGSIVSTTDWRFDRPSQRLYRNPDTGSWPTVDQKWAECSEPGSFCIDVVVGTAPDAWALQTATTLTCELVASCEGGKCRIPRNATSVTGQGVTVTLRDSDINNFLPEVTAWVAAVNPHKARLPAMVSSPELDRTGGVGHGGRALAMARSGCGCC